MTMQYRVRYLRVGEPLVHEDVRKYRKDAVVRGVLDEGGNSL